MDGSKEAAMKTVREAALRERVAEAMTLGNADIVQRIGEFLIEGRDAELHGIRPGKFARERGLNRTKTVKAFLQLTKTGVFDLHWTVHCPHCKGGSQDSSSLADLTRDAFCPFCQQGYEADFDRSVELSFQVNPAVVSFEGANPFDLSIGAIDLEPGVGIEIEPAGEHYLEYPIALGNYLLLDRADRVAVNFAVGPGEESAQEITLSLGKDSPPIQVVPLAPGRIRLRIRNAMDETAEFLFARMADPEWIDAALATTLQEFRDFFSKEMLSPEETFSIRNLALIFTDIKGSTEMYERLGDSKAFYLVKEHFKIMEEVVRRNDGGIVKTIGDAVMAVFRRPDQAIVAAREMIDEFDRFNLENKTKDQIVIKVGVHAGPCIAVTLNERIDYFGTSVNTAARIQGLSDGRDVMVSERFFRESGAARALESSGWSWESFTTSLKGLSSAHEVYKLVKA
jgi:class 3 adenylate cyclase